jgi:hypothetical protein
MGMDLNTARGMNVNAAGAGIAVAAAFLCQEAFQH